METLDQTFRVLSLTDPAQSYEVNLQKNTCSCPAWKYQRKPVSQRTCKHLRQFREDDDEAAPDHPARMRFGAEPPPLQLIANYPSTKMNFHDASYVWSEKYDGVRVYIRDGTGTTRGGIAFDMRDMQLPFVSEHPETAFDAELVMREYPSNHNRVMWALNSGRLELLSVRVFDLVDTGAPFQDRWSRAETMVPPEYRVKYNELRGAQDLQEQIVDIQTRGGEGVVVRNLRGEYAPNKRQATNAFKVKVIGVIPVKVA